MQVLPLPCHPALPAPARQPVPSGPGSSEITCGPALPNTYSAVRSIPPPSHCSPPPPPRSQPPPGPHPSQRNAAQVQGDLPCLAPTARRPFPGGKTSQEPTHRASQASGGHKTPCVSSKGSPPGMQSPVITLCPSRDTGVEPIPEGNKHHPFKEIGTEEQPEGRRNIPEKTQARETAEEPVSSGSTGCPSVPAGCCTSSRALGAPQAPQQLWLGSQFCCRASPARTQPANGSPGALQLDKDPGAQRHQ